MEEAWEWTPEDQEAREARIQGRGARPQRLLSAGRLKAWVVLSPRATALPICGALGGFVGPLRWLSDK